MNPGNVNQIWVPVSSSTLDGFTPPGPASSLLTSAARLFAGRDYHEEKQKSQKAWHDRYGDTQGCYKRTCPVCSATFYATMPTARFCDSTCSSKHQWRMLKLCRRPTPPKVCPTCSASFAPARSDAVYCSAKCKQSHHRAALRIAKGLNTAHFASVTQEVALGHDAMRILLRDGQWHDTKSIQLADEDAAKVWIIRNQFGRRNITLASRCELAEKLAEALKPKAKANQSDGGGDRKSKKGKSGSPILGKAVDTLKDAQRFINQELKAGRLEQEEIDSAIRVRLVQIRELAEATA